MFTITSQDLKNSLFWEKYSYSDVCYVILKNYDVLQFDGGQIWLTTKNGYKWLNSLFGYEWLNTKEGKIWLRTGKKIEKNIITP